MSQGMSILTGIKAKIHRHVQINAYFHTRTCISTGRAVITRSTTWKSELPKELECNGERKFRFGNFSSDGNSGPDENGGVLNCRI